MDRKYIEANHILERYVSGQLPVDEAEAFEVYCLEHPDVAEELEYVRAMKEGLHGVEQAPAAAEPRSWLTSPAYAMAASVVAAIGIGSTLYFANQTTDPPAGGAVISEIYVEPMRGADTAEFTIDAGGGAVIVRLDVGPDPAPPYDVSIRTSDRKLTLTGLTSIAPSGELIVWLADIRAGDLEISIVDAQGTEQRYSVRLSATD